MKKPRYETSIQLGSKNTSENIMLAVLATHQLDWALRSVNDFELEAYTRFSWKSVSEKVVIAVDQEGIINLVSECRGTQLIDWGKNKDNARNFEKTVKTLNDQLSNQDLKKTYDQLSGSHWKLPKVTDHANRMIAAIT